MALGFVPSNHLRLHCISLVWLSLFAAAYLSYQRYGFHPYSHAGPLHTDSHDPALAALAEAVNRLKEGRIAFDVPREMKGRKRNESKLGLREVPR